MKKLLLIVLMSLLFSGVVTASSINGDYKGNPIVKIMSNGKQLETDEVPAVILDGHTVVPISTLRQLGASVTWDAYGYSVDIKLPLYGQQNQSTDKTTVISAIKKDNANAAKWNAKNVNYVINELGAYVSVDVLTTSDIPTDFNNIATVSVYLKDTDADMIFVNYYIGNYMSGTYTIYREDVENMLHSNSLISVDDYSKKWKWNPNNGK